MDGEFPLLKPGNNLISWSGDVTSLVIQPNWRYLV
jgi:phage-related protein